MAGYLMKINYSPTGMQGVLREGGNARREMAARTVESAGGQLKAFYFAFGDTDVYLVADFPDAASAASVAMQVGAAGGATVETVVLITPDEVDAAVGMEVDYTPPGG